MTEINISSEIKAHRPSSYHQKLLDLISQSLKYLNSLVPLQDSPPNLILQPFSFLIRYNGILGHTFQSRLFLSFFYIGFDCLRNLKLPNSPLSFLLSY